MLEHLNGVYVEVSDDLWDGQAPSLSPWYVVLQTVDCSGAEDYKHTLYGQTYWDIWHWQLVELPIPTELKDY